MPIQTGGVMCSETEGSVVIKKKVALVGVGGGGMNTLEELLRGGVPAARFIAVNRDTASLKKSKAQDKIGLDVLNHAPESIAEAVRQKEIVIRKLFNGLDAVVLVAGMGGMTGSYALPEIAHIAKKSGLTIWAVVTRPFDFEGEKRSREARKGIDLLTQHADAVICVNNQDLIKECEKNTSMLEAFRRVDATVAEVVAMITAHGELAEGMLHQLPISCSLLPNRSGNHFTEPSSPSCHPEEIADSESEGGKQHTDNACCSFCGKPRSGVKRLISGPSVFICNECVDQCVEITVEEAD